eukprot:355847-Chlamydomonas_euryale.AAC.3
MCWGRMKSKACVWALGLTESWPCASACTSPLCDRLQRRADTSYQAHQHYHPHPSTPSQGPLPAITWALPMPCPRPTQASATLHLPAPKTYGQAEASAGRAWVPIHTCPNRFIRKQTVGVEAQKDGHGSRRRQADTANRAGPCCSKAYNSMHWQALLQPALKRRAQRDGSPVRSALGVRRRRGTSLTAFAVRWYSCIGGRCCMLSTDGGRSAF